MILHAVYLSLTKDADPAELADVMTGLADLVGQIEGFTGVWHGPNVDAEGKSPEAHYGIHAAFANRAALDRYAGDSRHKSLGGRLVTLCGGADRIKVYDIDTGE